MKWRAASSDFCETLATSTTCVHLSLRQLTNAGKHTDSDHKWRWTDHDGDWMIFCCAEEDTTIRLRRCGIPAIRICHIMLTYLLTPWCRVLPEQLTGLQPVKKFPAFHGTRRFITALTSVRQLSLSWASPIHSIYPHPTSWISVLILSTHLRLGLPVA